MAGLVINEMWAYCQIDETGDEGVIAMFDRPNKTWMPLVAADMARVEQMRGIAQETAKVTGRPVTLKRFATMTTEETFQP